MDESKLDRSIYVLELERSNYYVGWTTQLDNALKRHFNGKGASWVKQNKPVELVEVYNLENSTKSEAVTETNKLLLKYMEKYGWDSARSTVFNLCDNKMHFNLLMKRHLIDENYQLKDLNYQANKNYQLYCLLLAEGRYYVGISKDPYVRFTEHKNGGSKGAKYTREYPPEKLLFSQDLGLTDVTNYTKMETQATLNLMGKVGCSRVRGGDLVCVEDKLLYELWKKTILSNRNKFSFPKKWLSYSFEDFSKKYSVNNLSIKDIGSYNEITDKLFDIIY